MMPMLIDGKVWYFCFNCDDWIVFLWGCIICDKVLENQDGKTFYCDSCIEKYTIPAQDMPLWAISKRFANRLTDSPQDYTFINFSVLINNKIWEITSMVITVGGIRLATWYGTPDQKIFAGFFTSFNEASRAVCGIIRRQG